MFFAAAICLVCIIVVGAFVLGFRMEKRRLAAIASEAGRLGLGFKPGRNPDLAARVRHLHGIGHGNEEYAENVLTGMHRGHALTTFEFHNTTTSSDNEHGTQTDHHYWQVVLVDLGRPLPPLQISPENLLTKLAQFLGAEDIEAGSREFSRRFRIRSPDAAFAREFCSEQVSDLLLAHPNASVEVSDRFLAFVYPGRITPADLAARLDLAADLRETVPASLASP